MADAWEAVEHLAEVVAELEPHAATEPATVTLLGRLAADRRGLLSAAGYDRSDAAPSQGPLIGNAHVR